MVEAVAVKTKLLGPAMAFNVWCQKQWQSSPYHLAFGGGGRSDVFGLVLWNVLTMVPCPHFHLFSNSENCEQPFYFSINFLFAKFRVSFYCLELWANECPMALSLLYFYTIGIQYGTSPDFLSLQGLPWCPSHPDLSWFSALLISTPRGGWEQTVW